MERWLEVVVVLGVCVPFGSFGCSRSVCVFNRKGFISGRESLLIEKKSCLIAPAALLIVL